MSKLSRLKVALAVGLVAFSPLVGAAPAVTGKITFKGTAPKPELVRMNADPICARESKGKKVYQDDLVVGADSGIANVFVYVKEGVKKETVPPAPAQPVVFDQRGCVYTPKISPIRVGQPLKVVNSDPLLHNVHAVSKADQGFNVGMPNKGELPDRKFSNPELGLRVKCDVHGWMNAYIHVVDHPYFAVTDAKGEFSIADLPPGEYVIEARHEKLGSQAKKVKVADATGAKADFSFTTGAKP